MRHNNDPVTARAVVESLVIVAGFLAMCALPRIGSVAGGLLAGAALAVGILAIARTGDGAFDRDVVDRDD